MAKKEQNSVAKRKASHQKPESRSAPISKLGIYDAGRFAEVMSALMTDLLTGAVAPDVANATCNAGGKLLKVVEMQSKRGGGALQLVAQRAAGK